MLRRLDESLNAEAIDESITKFKNQTIFQVADDRGGLTSVEERRHARNDVFNTDDPNGWWPENGSVEETGSEREAIFRAAYILALDMKKKRAAEGRVKKIHSLWVRGLDRVEVYVIELESEILVQWLTPDVPTSPEPSKTVPPPGAIVNPITDEKIFAVGTATRIDEYVARFDSAQGYDTNGRSDGYPELPGVKWFHVIGY
jgi:hypothetical protein